MSTRLDTFTYSALGGDFGVVSCSINLILASSRKERFDAFLTLPARSLEAKERSMVTDEDEAAVATDEERVRGEVEKSVGFKATRGKASKTLEAQEGLDKRQAAHW